MFSVDITNSSSYSIRACSISSYDMTTYSEILIRSGEDDTINALAGTLIAIVGTSGNADLSSSDWNNDLENVVDTPGGSVYYVPFTASGTAHIMVQDW